MVNLFVILGIINLLSSETNAFPFNPQPNLYLNNAQLKQRLQTMQSQGIKFMKQKCPSVRNVEYLRFGELNAPVRILLVCGVHARQLLPVDVCLQYLRNYAKITRIKRYVRFDVFIMPNSERENVLKGDYQIRKSPTGVDLNRNYNVSWSFGDSNRYSETYQGPKPLSQPFTSCIDKLLSARNYTSVLDVHTGQLHLMFNAMNISAKNYFKTFLGKIQQTYCPACRISSMQDMGNNIVSGTLANYATSQYKVPFSFVFQIYSSHIIESQNIYNLTNYFKKFNPNSVQTKEFYTKKWINAFHSAFMGIIDWKGLK